MSFSNPWFLAVLIGVVGVFHLELLATLLNLKQLNRPVPPTLTDVFPEEDRERRNAYITDRARVGFSLNAASFTALIAFWWSGGFGWLQTTMASAGHGPVVTGVAVLAVFSLVQTWLQLPFEAWSTFGVEARYGFNRTTLGTFISDHFKGLTLMALLGLPVATMVVWLFETQPWAPLYVWGFLVAFSALMTWLSPRWFLPMFLSFRPLETGPLREAIFELAKRLDFPVHEVSIVDGSRRSTKANAFFAGFGSTRRIALYDTLLETHDTEEILAILAHEIGHNKRRHVPTSLALNWLELAITAALLAWLLHTPAFFAAFGVTGTPTGMGLVLFGILYQPISLLTGLIGLAISRKHEFEADAFAAHAVGSPEPLMRGLRKLARDQLTHPSPHALSVALHHSHPPLAERLAALARG